MNWLRGRKEIRALVHHGPGCRKKGVGLVPRWAAEEKIFLILLDPGQGVFDQSTTARRDECCVSPWAARKNGSDDAESPDCVVILMMPQIIEAMLTHKRTGLDAWSRGKKDAVRGNEIKRT